MEKAHADADEEVEMAGEGAEAEEAGPSTEIFKAQVRQWGCFWE